MCLTNPDEHFITPIYRQEWRNFQMLIAYIYARWLF